MTTPEATTTPRPLRADARRNRDKILAGARAAFEELGLQAQMEDIARRSGVGVGTVYRHFPTKEALVRALVVDKVEVMAALAAQFLEPAKEDGWGALSGFVHACAEHHVRDRALAQVVSTTPASEFIEIAMDSGFMKSIATLLRHAQREGVARKDLVATDLGLLFCGMSAVVQSFGEAAAPRYIELVLAGMTNNEAPRLPAPPRVANPRA
jgi:AcrR family transcriptional regulator